VSTSRKKKDEEKKQKTRDAQYKCFVHSYRIKKSVCLFAMHLKTV